MYTTKLASLDKIELSYVSCGVTRKLVLNRQKITAADCLEILAERSISKFWAWDEFLVSRTRDGGVVIHCQNTRSQFTIDRGQVVSTFTTIMGLLEQKNVAYDLHAELIEYADNLITLNLTIGDVFKDVAIIHKENIAAWNRKQLDYIDLKYGSQSIFHLTRESFVIVKTGNVDMRLCVRKSEDFINYLANLIAHPH